MTPDLNHQLIEWFSQLPRAALDDAAAGLKRREFSAGQMIFERGDAGDSILFVQTGRVLGVYWTASGREIIYNDLGPGGAFGEISVITGAPRSLSLYARTACALYEMPGERFRALMERYPALRDAIMLTMINRVRHLTERVHELTSYSVDDRLKAYLLRIALERGAFGAGRCLGDLPTHADIANSIGANREAVSRGLTKLMRDGVISSGAKQVRILQPDALEVSD